MHGKLAPEAAPRRYYRAYITQACAPENAPTGSSGHIDTHVSQTT